MCESFKEINANITFDVYIWCVLSTGEDRAGSRQAEVQTDHPGDERELRLSIGESQGYSHVWQAAGWEGIARERCGNALADALFMFSKLMLLITIYLV